MKTYSVRTKGAKKWNVIKANSPAEAVMIHVTQKKKQKFWGYPQ